MRIKRARRKRREPFTKLITHLEDELWILNIPVKVSIYPNKVPETGGRCDNGPCC
jgi:hypothetical protein